MTVNSRLVRGLAGLLVFGIAFVLAVRTVFTPWTWSLPGRWQGTMSTTSGYHADVWLDLRHPLATGCFGCATLAGEATICDSAGSRSYRLWGDVEDRSGNRFNLATRQTEGRTDGPRLGGLSGQFADDRMSLATRFIDAGPVTTRSTKNDDGRQTFGIMGKPNDGSAEAAWTMRRSRLSDQPTCQSGRLFR